MKLLGSGQKDAYKDAGAAGAGAGSSGYAVRMIDIGDIDQVKADKHWRIKGTDMPLEQK